MTHRSADRRPSFQQQVSSRLFAAVADHVEANLGALGQAVIASLLHRRDMHKHVLAAARRPAE
jgi:hypothetical protein